MAVVGALELEGYLEEAPPPSVCVLEGEDEALVARSLGLLLELLAPQEKPGSVVRRFETVERPAQVFDELRTIPFMGMEGRRVVVVEDGDAFLREHRDRLLRYLESPSSTGTLILRAAGLDGRRKETKALREVGLVVQCGRLRWRQAESWLRTRARELGGAVTDRAASELVRAVGPNVAALDRELEKLIAYCQPEGRITADAVTEMVARGRSRSIFELGDMISEGRKADAIAFCERLLLRGEAPEGIVAVLASQMRRQWQVKRLQDVDASPRDIEKATGLPGFVVRKSLQTIGGLSDDWFAERLAILSEADYSLKTESLQADERRVWVETLVARLSRTAGRAAAERRR